MGINELTAAIIGGALEVHRELGPGLLESVYQSSLLVELHSRGLAVQKEVPLPVIYKGQRVSETGFRLDLLVEGLVVVELKSVEKVLPVHTKQLLTYLRLADKQLGLLINFNESLLRNGINRVVNGLKE